MQVCNAHFLNVGPSAFLMTGNVNISTLFFLGQLCHKRTCAFPSVYFLDLCAACGNVYGMIHRGVNAGYRGR